MGPLWASGLTVVLVTVVVVAVPIDQGDDASYFIFDVTPVRDEGLQRLSELQNELDFFDRPTDVFKPSTVRVYEWQMDILKSGFEDKLWTMTNKTDVVMKQVEKERAKLNKRKEHRSKRAAAPWSNFSPNEYHDFFEIENWLRNIANQFVAYNRKELVELHQPGYSVEGKPMLILRIGTKQNFRKPAIFVDGGIHAREWASPSSVLYIIYQLLMGYNSDYAGVRYLLDNVDFYLAPVINPDGYQYSHEKDRFWRKNRRRGISGRGYNPQCHGVDLNRNFDYNWGGTDASMNPCAQNYKGLAPLSEPEAKALDKFMNDKTPYIKAYITLHTYGNMWFIPYGDRRNHLADNYNEQYKVGKEAAKEIERVGGSRYQVGSSAQLLYPAAGTSDDWAHGKLNIPWSFGVEVGPTRSGFDPPEKDLNNMGRELYAAVTSIARQVINQRYFSGEAANSRALLLSRFRNRNRNNRN